LHFLKWVLGLAPPQVWTTDAERDCLARHAAGKQRVVEIGVWHAGTSKRLRSAMAHDGVFYAIDPYPPGRLGVSLPRVIGRAELGQVPNARVVWVRQQGVDAATSPAMKAAAPFDFVFIDAAQTYEALSAEWGCWSPLVARGGIIALHDTLRMAGDVTSEQTSVVFAREVIFTDSRFELLESIDTLTVLRRR
jgi:predicted O-methyltransferase YrrM